MTEYFLPTVVIIALLMLIWDCIEVGRNDAANLVNAVFGARVMSRNVAVLIAGIAVVLGATFSTTVMETARKGIFDPTLLTIQAAIVIYITAYIVDTVLLHTYSAFGMPVSTTASLVFELVGAAIGVSLFTEAFVDPATAEAIVNWAKVKTVVSAILISILISGVAGWMMQRVFRAAIEDKPDDHMRILLHGPWIAGLMFAGLAWFLLMKGLKHVPAIKSLRANTLDEYGPIAVLLILWALFTLIVHVWLTVSGERGTRSLFKVTAIVGMLCLAFAFGQNDLANCASPGLSSLWLWKNADAGTAIASKVDIPQWALFACGLLMVIGMRSKNAQRVTRAAVNTGSQYDHVALYAPKWCRSIAKIFIKKQTLDVELAPAPSRDDEGNRIHFDPMRASVIMSVSASVIALASSNGIPVSTTYVTFACVVATGWADGVMTRGDGDRKIGRAIWVVFSWFAGALIAMVAAAVVAIVIFKLNMIGLILGLGANIGIRFLVNKRSDVHEKTFHKAAAAKISEKEGTAG